MLAGAGHHGAGRRDPAGAARAAPRAAAARLRGAGGVPRQGGAAARRPSRAAAPNTGFGAGVDDVLGEIGRRVGGGKTSATLAERLVQAGYHDRRAAGGLHRRQGRAAGRRGCGVGAADPVASHRPEPSRQDHRWRCAAPGFLFFLPNLVVASRRASAAPKSAGTCPTRSTCSRSARPPAWAWTWRWNSVSDEVRAVSPTLADEMALTNLEIHLGARAWSRCATWPAAPAPTSCRRSSRCSCSPRRFGTSVVDALRTYANAMRETRSNT